MTAAENPPGVPVARDRLRVLAEGPSPRDVAEALMPGDRDRFVAEYEALLEQARTSLDLGPVFDLVDRWRGLAALQLDPQRYRRHLERAVELATGVPVTGRETVAELKEKIGA